MTQPHEAAGSTHASNERKKLFGWLTVEMLFQLAVVLVCLSTAYAFLSSDVQATARDVQEIKAQIKAQSEQVAAALSDSRTAMTVNAQQQGEIKAMTENRDSDREVLMKINSNVAVLLDRTDPKQAKDER